MSRRKKAEKAGSKILNLLPGCEECVWEGPNGYNCSSKQNCKGKNISKLPEGEVQWPWTRLAIVLSQVLIKE